MTDERRMRLVGPGVMLISAAIFGYFGFATTFVHTSSITGQTLWFVIVYEWTLKGAAIAFLACAMMTFIAPIAGTLTYGVFGLASAAGLTIAGILDLLDTQHTVQGPLLTFLFVFIIAIVSIGSLKDAAAAMREKAPIE